MSFNQISAGSRNINQLVSNREFLPDLWERLQGEVIWIKPLSERPLDIEYQFKYFMKQHESGRLFSVKPEAMNILKKYSWPGNTRELKNVVNRFQQRRVKKLDEGHLKSLLQKTLKQNDSLVNVDILEYASKNGLSETIEKITEEIVRHSYGQNSNNMRRTLVELGISRRLFYKHKPIEGGVLYGH